MGGEVSTQNRRSLPYPQPPHSHILPFDREKSEMKLPKPPADLTASQRKQFRKMLKTLVERGIDPLARASLVSDFVRLEDRILNLQAAENEAESAQKMPVSRAVNVAVSERRRLHDAIFKGARKIDPQDTASVQTEEESEADRHWRAWFWKRPRPAGFTHDELQTRFGRPRMGVMIWPTWDAEQDWKAMAKASGSLGPPKAQVREFVAKHGYAFRAVMPKNVQEG